MVDKSTGTFFSLRLFFLTFWQIFVVFFLLTSSVTAAAQKPFAFAVSAMTSPATTFKHFTEFRDYLAAKLGQPVLLKQRRTYAEINQLLKDDEVSMAFTCTGGFLDGRRAFGLEVLVTPIVKGATTYQSYVIVPKNHSAKTMADLRGSVFAFTDPLSLTGRIYPTATINTMGFKTKDFFKKTFYTASHDKSITAVARGIADAAAVDSLIFDSNMKIAGSDAHQVKVIHTSPLFGMPPIVVSPDLRKEKKRLLLKVLLNMAEDAEGEKILDALEMDGFALPDPSMYRSALVLINQITE